MKKSNSKIATIAIFQGLIIFAVLANYFILRGNVTLENTHSNATVQEISNYLNETGENRTFGSIYGNEQQSVKKTFEQILVRGIQGKKMYNPNSIYYVSQKDDKYTPIEYSVGGELYTPTALMMPVINQEIDVREYFGLTFLTTISDQYPHKRSNSALISREIADQIISEENLKKGDYQSLISKYMNFKVTKDTTFYNNFFLAGVFDDSDEIGRFYKDAYGTFIIVPHNVDKYFIKNLKLNFDFGLNAVFNKALLNGVERAIKTSRNTFDWDIYQKDIDGIFTVGSISETKLKSQEYFESLKGFDKSPQNFLAALFFLLFLTALGTLLSILNQGKKFYIMFLLSCAIGISLTTVITSIRVCDVIPINEYIKINQTAEIRAAAIFMIVVCGILTMLIPRAIDVIKKYI